MLMTTTAARAEEPAPYCVGEYAEDLSRLTPASRELEKQPYSYCVRNTATYECLSYGDDGSVRRTRKKAIAHGTAFAYQKQASTGETLLITNEHVTDWPAVTDEQHVVDGVPAGCKRVSEAIRIVDNEDDDFDRDDIPLTKVVSDPELDAAVLKTKSQLTLMPWKIGKSSALRERDVVEVRGFPLGAFRATNVGKVISPHDHDDQGEWNHDDFVIDALLSAGNSGSPVLAVSCKTGEFELVGIYHAGYVQGSALNVVIAIDQLRSLMTTLKRPARQKGDPVATLDGGARGVLTRQLATPGVEPFFPFGSLVARVSPRMDGALVFQVFSRDFPFTAAPIFAFEDLPSTTGGFGEPGRLWFGSGRGLKRVQRSDLDTDSLAQTARIVEALRRDATAFFTFRSDRAAALGGTRAEFEKQARQARKLKKTQQLRRDLANTAAELAEHLAPRDSEPIAPVGELFITPVPPALATTAKDRPTR
jgi:serine protease Do